MLQLLGPMSVRMRVAPLRVAVVLILVEALVDLQIGVESLEAVQEFAEEQEEETGDTRNLGDQVDDRDDLDLGLEYRVIVGEENISNSVFEVPFIGICSISILIDITIYFTILVVVVKNDWIRLCEVLVEQVVVCDDMLFSYEMIFLIFSALFQKNMAHALKHRCVIFIF